jgi:hypothetical protein
LILVQVLSLQVLSLKHGKSLFRWGGAGAPSQSHLAFSPIRHSVQSDMQFSSAVRTYIWQRRLRTFLSGSIISLQVPGEKVHGEHHRL